MIHTFLKHAGQCAIQSSGFEGELLNYAISWGNVINLPVVIPTETVAVGRGGFTMRRQC